MKPHPALQIALLPLSWIYGAVVVSRAWLYRRGILKQKRLNGVVISVGNLTVGGTGKTPMVQWLAQRLGDAGMAIGVLTRGYRGSKGESDEVALLRSRLGARFQIGVGADRFAVGSALENHGVKGFILDDGFQHLGLARDVDLVLLDATNPFAGGHLLPAGGLREPKSALRRADLVVITRTEHAPALETIVRAHTEAPIFYARPKFEGVFAVMDPASGESRKDWTQRKYFAFCGIGNPAAFFSDLRTWGFSIVGQQDFPDHHKYERADMDRLQHKAHAAGAEALICTEKDIYNLQAAKLVGATGLPVFACVISLHVPREAELVGQIHRIIQRKRGGATP